MLKKYGLSTIVILFEVLENSCCLQLPNNACEESLETISYTSKCPSDFEEYQVAALRKNCSKYKNECRSFEYHCVLNDDTTKIMEVCAPSRYIQFGKCAEFNIGLRSIRRVFFSDCTTFKHPCPISYNSTESYRYSDCFNILVIKSTTMIAPKNTTENRNGSSTTDLPMLENQISSGKETKENSITAILLGIGIAVVLLLAAICYVVLRRKRKQKE
ncbi:uncharacterized protein LOC134232660 isoform X2 [Saccostrea cucullata]|uniref:uncharacterized protein LOC134232660 isoform X2 n=1 Tax=Saccostrea cuccullata TaxID=36930 RepID=UPI002ED4DF13